VTALSRRVAFIGSGNMAGAILEGLLRVGACRPEEIHAMDIRQARVDELAERHGVAGGTDLLAAISWAEVLVLGVKPQAFDKLLPAVGAGLDREVLVVSIAAGVPISAIEAHLPAGSRVVRTMPNTPALVDKGATAIAAGTHATADDIALVERMFSSVGVTVQVDESLLDAVTGLSGSGPAYIFMVIEALSDAGVKVGLHRRDAQLLAAHTVLGSAQLLLDTGEHPGRLKDMVTSPGGTAIAGLHTLESGGLRTTLMDAVEAATARSRELGLEMHAKLVLRDDDG
jgi:pyrroline-5-carboxylate reductase